MDPGKRIRLSYKGSCKISSIKLNLLGLSSETIKRISSAMGMDLDLVGVLGYWGKSDYPEFIYNKK